MRSLSTSGCLLAAIFVVGPASAGAEPAQGVALVEKYECQRCHEGTAATEAPREKHCVRCHQDILAGRFDAPEHVRDRWTRRIRSLTAVPSLADLGGFMRRDYFADYLQNPHDVRPGLVPMMPRLEMSSSDAEELAKFYVPEDEFRPGPPAAPDLIAHGRKLYERYRCYQCHDFSAAGIRRAKRTPYGATSLVMLAPDLRHTRRRLQPGIVAQWIHNPASVRPATTMPAFGVPMADAEAIAAFILHTPVKDLVKTLAPVRLPLLDRKVSFDEVSAKVFKRLCWHCHSSPDYARGDGGPGNTGGFGFVARGLDLSSYEGIAAGVVGPDGERMSVFAPDEAGDSLLVRSLRARAQEVAGTPVEGVRGMPMGLPPLSQPDIQLVASWVAQGRPR